MQVPAVPDLVALDHMLTKLNVLVELRATHDTVDRAEAILTEVAARIDALAESPSRHRDWRHQRFEVQRLLVDLDQVLYYTLD